MIYVFSTKLLGFAVSIFSIMLLFGNGNGPIISVNLKFAWADQITGTDGDDNLVGTVKADTIDGLQGDDS